MLQKIVTFLQMISILFLFDILMFSMNVMEYSAYLFYSNIVYSIFYSLYNNRKRKPIVENTEK